MLPFEIVEAGVCTTAVSSPTNIAAGGCETSIMPVIGSGSCCCDARFCDNERRFLSHRVKDQRRAMTIVRLITITNMIGAIEG